jgi:hypothetical protein
MRARTRLITRLLPAIAAGALVYAPGASAAPAPPMTVVVNSSGGTGANYFQVHAHPGATTKAGSLQIRNQSTHPITVNLDPVDGQTASTLGSAYGLRGTKPTGAAKWVVLGERKLTLNPRATANVPVSVQIPAGAKGGDFLAGIGVQAAQGSSQQTKGSLAVASVQRYAVGVETFLPGPRHPLVKLTGVKLTREPAGVTFSLLAANKGNVILKNVKGTATVSDGSGTVVKRTLGPGTFVSGTSIAYPMLVPSLTPNEGDSFRVQAEMKYPGGTAKIDKTVQFGKVAAKRQQDYGGPKATSSGGKSHLLPILLLLLIVGGALAAYLIRRRRGPGGRAAAPALDRAITQARANGEPLSVVLIGANGDSAQKLSAGVRSCLRPKDGLYRTDGSGLLVIAPDTTPEAGEVLAAEIKRQLSRAGNGSPAVIPVTSAAQSSAEELLEAAAEVSGVPAAAPVAPPAAGNGNGNGNGHHDQAPAQANGTEANAVLSDNRPQYPG